MLEADHHEPPTRVNHKGAQQRPRICHVAAASAGGSAGAGIESDAEQSDMNCQGLALPDGPMSVNDGFHWAEHFAEPLRQNKYNIDFWKELCEKWQDGLVLSSDYSGCGQFETAAGIIRNIVQRAGGHHAGGSLGKDWVLHRAIYLHPHCRQVLQAHRPHSPACIFRRHA